jgi:hypothetical protein
VVDQNSVIVAVVDQNSVIVAVVDQNSVIVAVADQNSVVVDNKVLLVPHHLLFAVGIDPDSFACPVLDMSTEILVD